jgi:hypothetical protein
LWEIEASTNDLVQAVSYPMPDTLRADAATYLDSVEDARAVFRRINPHFFIGERAVSTLFADIAVSLEEYGSPDLERPIARLNSS